MNEADYKKQIADLKAENEQLRQNSVTFDTVKELEKDARKKAIAEFYTAIAFEIKTNKVEPYIDDITKVGLLKTIAYVMVRKIWENEK